MISLHEQYRPRTWADVVGQDKVVKQIEAVRRRGLGGRAFWISGASGTGKTTIARLIAGEVSTEFATTEIDAETLTAKRIGEFESGCRSRPLGGGCWCLIVNEAHGLSKSAVRQLLVTLERVPPHAVWIFTTTSDGQQQLFDDCVDAHPLLSRCVLLPLSRQGLAKPFAEHARAIAQREGCDGQPIARYVRLVQDCKNNLRAVLQAIESGVMCAD